MKCNNESHECVYGGCYNHAPYTLPDIDDYYCWTHAQHRGKEWNIHFSCWIKEKCKKLKASRGEKGDGDKG